MVGMDFGVCRSRSGSWVRSRGRVSLVVGVWGAGQIFRVSCPT